MIQIFPGRTGDEAWLKAAHYFREAKGLQQASRAGPTRELLHAAFVIDDPRQRWVVSRSPAMSPAFAIAEVVWIFTGSNDLQFLQYWAPTFGRFSDDGKTLHGAYGHRLRAHHGIDQLLRAYEALKHQPESRQVVLQIWDTKVDFPEVDGKPRSKDIPCNTQSLLKIRDGKLEWMQIIRSNDMHLGVPHNFVQFTTIQEVLAGWLGLGLGSYNQISDSLHVYDKDNNFVTSSVDVKAQENSDSLAATKDESQELFAELRRRGDLLTAPDLTIPKMRELTVWDAAPPAYQNLLKILSASSSYIRKWTEEASQVSSAISNPVLQQLWKRWVDRKAA